LQPLARASRIVLGVTLMVVLTATAHGNPASTARAGVSAKPPPPCRVISNPKDVLPAKSSTLLTVQLGYQCILAHYVTGTTSLDDRTLLRGAYNAVENDLKQAGVTVPASPVPSMTGSHDVDWTIFAQWFNQLLSGYGSSSLLSNSLAQVCLSGMASALKDEHTVYLPAQYMQQVSAQLADGPIPTLGFEMSPVTDTVKLPIYVTDVFGSGPAAAAGLRPGDIITAIDGSPPVSEGQPTLSLFDLLVPKSGTTLSLTIDRPATGETKTVSMTIRTLTMPVIKSKVLPSGIEYVKLYSFTADSAHQVLKALQAFAKSASPTGVILDLRNNAGGYADQAARIISAFVHKQVIGYIVDGSGNRVAQHTDDSILLLHLPLAVLIDGGSASSSELVAEAIKDLHAGIVVGQRSQGAIAEAEFFNLDDGGGMEITEKRVLGAKAEKLEGVGVVPGAAAVASPQDLSAGRDPVIDRAVQALQAG
jgi:carboxyl-terminal processing protease